MNRTIRRYKKAEHIIYFSGPIFSVTDPMCGDKADVVVHSWSCNDKISHLNPGPLESLNP